MSVTQSMMILTLGSTTGELESNGVMDQQSPASSPDYYATHAQSVGSMSGDMASSSDNSSTETPVDSNEAPLSYSATVVVGLMASVLSLLITVGNSFTLIVFALRKSLRKFGDFFIINLAIADLAIGVMSIPPYIPYLLTGTWQAGFSYCKFWLLWDYVTPAASTFCICVISIDRYLLVVHPLLYRRIQSTRLLVIMLAIPWGGVFLIFGPSILLWELTFGPKIAPGVCHVPFSDYLPFLLFTSFVEFIIPFTVVAMTNVMLFLRIRTRMRTKVSDHFTPSPTHKSSAAVRDQDRSEQHATRVAVFTTQTASHLSPWKASTDKVSQEGSTTNNVVNLGLEAEGHTNTSMDDTGDVGEATTKQSSSKPQRGLRETTTSTAVKSSTTTRRRARKDVRVARSLFVLVMVFAVCWMPYEILALVSAHCEDCVDEDLFEFSFWLLWINSTLNPVLYPILHRRFREAAASVIAGCRKCGSCRS